MTSFSNYPPPAAANAAAGYTAGANIRITCSGVGDASVEKAIRIPRTNVRITKITTIRESGAVHPLITLYSRSGRLVGTAADAAYITHQYTPNATPHTEVPTGGRDHQAHEPNTGEGDTSHLDAYVWVVVDNAAAWTGTVQFSGDAEPQES